MIATGKRKRDGNITQEKRTEGKVFRKSVLEKFRISFPQMTPNVSSANPPVERRSIE